MSGERKKGKTKPSCWLTPQETARLKEAAKAYGLNVSDFIKYAIETAAKKKGVVKNEKDEN